MEGTLEALDSQFLSRGSRLNDNANQRRATQHLCTLTLAAVQRIATIATIPIFFPIVSYLVEIINPKSSIFNDLRLVKDTGSVVAVRQRRITGQESKIEIALDADIIAESRTYVGYKRMNSQFEIHAPSEACTRNRLTTYQKRACISPCQSFLRLRDLPGAWQSFVLKRSPGRNKRRWLE